MNVNLKDLKPGDKHYKAYVGPPEKYDLVGAMQFNLLTNFGLRDFHKLLDIGCGSLRSGKLMISYLRKGNYYGLEPNNWLIEEGIRHELGNDIISIKTPTFLNSENFELSKFNKKFDFVIAQSIFSHTSKRQIDTCLNEVKQVLNSQGVFLATFVLGDKDYEGEEWVYPECVTFTEEFILNACSRANLKGKMLNTHHPNNQTWYAICHPENFIDVISKINALPVIPKMWMHKIEGMKSNKLLNNYFTRKLYHFLK